MDHIRGLQVWGSLIVAGAVASIATQGCRLATGSDEEVTRNLVEADGEPRGTYRVIEPRPPEASPAEQQAMMKTAKAKRTIFINGKGGTFKGGYDDARKNRSSIVGGTANVPAYEKGAASWSTLMSCVRDQFTRWNVDITDVDPGEATPHLECVVGGRPGHIGMGSGVGGVAPMNGDCSVVENAVVYVFSQQFKSVQVECEVAVQEIGHALGLDHELLCEDPMTYLNGCGKKSLQDKDAYCGESSPRSCACGGSKQNSVKFLNKLLGPREDIPPPGGDGGAPPPPPPSDGGAPPPPDGGAPPPPPDGGAPPPPPPPGEDKLGPTIAALNPADGATLPANTTVSISADVSDPSGVAEATLQWTIGGTTSNLRCGDFLGEVTCSVSGATHTWRVPVGSGVRQWAVRAVDKKGQVSASTPRTLNLSGDAPPPPPPPSGGPSITFLEPTAGSTYARGAHIHVRAKLTDDGSVSSARMLWKSPVGDVPYDLKPMSGDTWGVDIDVSTVAVSGARTITITAVDNLGNKTSVVQALAIGP